MIGRMMSDKNSNSGASGWVTTIPGSHPSQTLKIKIKTVAVTNSGIVMANIAVVDIHRSGARSRQRAAMIPSRMASGIPTSDAVAPRMTVLRKRLLTVSETGFLSLSEMPKSPLTAPPIHST